MNTEVLLLGVCVGASMCFGACAVAMYRRGRVQTLYPLGHITDGTTYFFRLPVLEEDQKTVTLEDVSAFAFAELEECDVPQNVLAAVQIDVSGCMIRVTGTPEHIRSIETVHRRWLNQIVGVPTEDCEVTEQTV